MILVDTHTHLYAEEFDTDSNEMIARAINSGVKKMFLPNIDSTSIAPMLSLCEKFKDNCFPMMGLHPCSVKENYKEELAIVEKELENKKYIGVGETGIDLYWDKTFLAEQEDSFRTQIGWAVAKNLPVIIHTRNSFENAFAIVNEFKGKAKGIFHCFSGTTEDADKIISLGSFKMGIGGVLTYKNSTLPEVIQKIDIRHLVLETDSPYLPPVPHRGKRNESAFIPLIAQKLAEVKNISLEEVAESTTRNSKEVFGL
jgi:TatD DNase family protein